MHIAVCRRSAFLPEEQHRPLVGKNRSIFSRNLAECEKAGYAVLEESRWHLTPQGFLVSNQIIGGMLDVLAAEKQRRADAAARGDFRIHLD